MHMGQNYKYLLVIWFFLEDVYMPKKGFIDDEKSSCIFHNFDDRFLQISSYWLYFDDRLEYFNMM
mgnify:CR=1 FL=1